MERTTSRLDLHGVKHQNVDIIVENFILLNQSSFPLIICGNSPKMISLAKIVIDRIGCETEMYQYGNIIVKRFTT